MIKGCTIYPFSKFLISSELAPAARGSHDAGSRNLAFAFFDISVLHKRTSIRWKNFPLQYFRHTVINTPM